MSFGSAVGWEEAACAEAGDQKMNQLGLFVFV